jgi:membrane-bound lytic murein transglycosylase A
MWLRFRSFLLLILLAACQTQPAPIKVITPPAPAVPPSALPPQLPAWETPAAFSDLPNWPAARLEAAVSAFKRSCEKFSGLEITADLSDARPWAAAGGRLG